MPRKYCCRCKGNDVFPDSGFLYVFLNFRDSRYFFVLRVCGVLWYLPAEIGRNLPFMSVSNRLCRNLLFSFPLCYNELTRSKTV